MADGLRMLVTTTLQKRLANPLTRLLPMQPVVETTGRRSGQPRRTPVGGRLADNQFWVVSEFGESSQWVRNVKAEPRVRLRLNGKWRTGTAHLMSEDDPHARLRSLPQIARLGVRAMGTNLLTVRIDLDD